MSLYASRCLTSTVTKQSSECESCFVVELHNQADHIVVGKIHYVVFPLIFFYFQWWTSASCLFSWQSCQSGALVLHNQFSDDRRILVWSQRISPSNAVQIACPCFDWQLTLHVGEQPENNLRYMSDFLSLNACRRAAVHSIQTVSQQLSIWHMRCWRYGCDDSVADPESWYIQVQWQVLFASSPSS